MIWMRAKLTADPFGAALIKTKSTGISKKAVLAWMEENSSVTIAVSFPMLFGFSPHLSIRSFYHLTTVQYWLKILL
jgi:hypothetical protein